MSYVAYHKDSGYFHPGIMKYGSPKLLTSAGSVKRAITCWTKRMQRAFDKKHLTPHELPKMEDYIIAKREDMPKFTKIVKNMLSKQDVEIDVNTPSYLDPSCEAYHSM